MPCTHPAPTDTPGGAMTPPDDQLAERRAVLAALNEAARRAIEASRRGDRDAWATADADWTAAIERGHAACLRDDDQIDD